MEFMKWNLFVFFFLLGGLSHLSCVYAEAVFEDYGCSSGHGNYTERSIYQQNLNRLLSNLSSKTSSRRFYNSTVGEFPDKVYGIYQCREDLSQDICNECINDATKKITQVCPLYGEGIVWYDECILRYANRSIFSLSETSPSIYAWYTDRVSNYDKFGPVVEKTMKTIVTQAVRTTSRGHFANTYAEFTSIDKMYCFAMCTPDLNEYDCKNCLTIALAKISTYYDKSKGVTTFYPSCQIGYDTELDQMAYVPVAPTLAQTPTPAPDLNMKGGIFRQVKSITGEAT